MKTVRWASIKGMAGPVAVAIGLASAGCGTNVGVNSPETHNAGVLDEVGDLYRNATYKLGKPPTSMKGLASGRDMFLMGYNAVDKGEVVVYWGVTPIAGDQSTDEILGYKADVPTSGGPVLLKNTQTKTLTAAEFAAAPKPSGGTSK